MSTLLFLESVKTVADLPEGDPEGSVRLVSILEEEVDRLYFYNNACDLFFYIRTAEAWEPYIFARTVPTWVRVAIQNGSIVVKNVELAWALSEGNDEKSMRDL